MHVLDANEIFWMTFYTADRIVESGNSDALVLYYRYLKQSRIQDTSKTLSLDKFMWKWLWRWDKRFYKAKKVLKELWLIDIIKTIWPDWKFEDNFVRVNYLIDENRIRNAGTTYEVIQSGRNAQSGNQPEKMLININKNNNISPSSDSNESSSGDNTTFLNSKNTEQGTSMRACVASYEDIQQVITDDSYRINNNKLLKCVVKMCELWYQVDKKENSIKELVNRIKEKAEIYNIKNADWSVAQWIMLQIFDQWIEYYKWNWKQIWNHKLSVTRFMINHNKPYSKNTKK